MPLTFVEVEEQKSFRIWIFFLVLLIVHLAVLSALTTSLARALSIPFAVLLQPRTIFLLLGAALTAAVIHFYFSAYDTTRFIRSNLAAAPPDPKDGVHQRLVNVMQEIQVATGHKRDIGCVVIPSLAMNAMALVDFRGNATIAITEGLLSRLTRDQLESVIAHEAHHILSGDCFETTVAAGLFGAPAAVLEKLSRVSEGRAFASPPFLLAWVLLKFGQILNMFISREREYRADAGAVRMTRNPMALAEVLDRLSRNWRGAGLIGSGLEMLCIAHPAARRLDESEGWWADLMSTHPPIRKRIEVLLTMAHAGLSELIAKTPPRTGAAATKPSEPVFYALDPQHLWQGPYTLPELSGLSWISPITWISDGGQAIERAWRLPVIDKAVFTRRLEQEQQRVTHFACPSCRQPLLETAYESTQLYQCHFCGGRLADNKKIPRIMARSDGPFTDRIQSLSNAVIRQNQLKNVRALSNEMNRRDIPLRNCPRCGRPMRRTFYTLAYPVEVDRCGDCDMTWFDPDELEMLQCMIANKMASEA